MPSSAALTPPSHPSKLILTSQLPGRPVRQPLNNADRLPVHSAARHERTTLEHPQDQVELGRSNGGTRAAADQGEASAMLD
jgi:hypothetical protein